MDYFAEQDAAFRKQLDALPNLGADADPRVTAALQQAQAEHDNLLPTLAIAMLLADLSQTTQIARQPERFFEKNLLLGKHPSSSAVNAYFGANILANLLLNSANPPLGLLLNLATLGVQVPTVKNNMQLGLRP